MNNANTDEELKEVNTAERLVILETKLDYLITHWDKAQLEDKELSSRVTALEYQRQWLLGITACLATLTGIGLFTLSSYIDDRIELYNEDRGLIADVCKEYRRANKNTTEMPKLCQI